MSDLTKLALGLEGLGLAWLVQSTVLIVLGLVAGRAAKRHGPALQSAVYRATLAAVILCPAASAGLAALGVDGLAIRFARTADATKTLEPPMNVEFAADAKAFLDGLAETKTFNTKPSPFVPAPPSSDSNPVYSVGKFKITSLPTIPPPFPERVPPERISFERVEARGQAAAAGAGAWALGAFLLLARMAVQQARMARIRRTAESAGPDAQATCDEIARRLETAPPPVRRSPFLPGPCLDGLFRPMILLPEESAEPRDAIAHELAHLARREGWWNLARRLALAALWPQPLAWILSRRLEATAEEVCDDVVISLGADRTRYAELLLATASRSLPPAAPAALGMVSLRSLLARRVARILDSSRPLSTRAGRRALLAVLPVGLTATVMAGLLNVGGLPQAEAQEPAAPKAAPNLPVAKPDAPADGMIRGRVTDDQGRPVAGAKVVAWRRWAGPKQPIGLRNYVPNLPIESRAAITDADGRYAIQDFDPPPVDEPSARYVGLRAAAKGFRPGGAAWRSPSPTARLGGDIRLEKGDQAIEGRVLDDQGRPVAGARVRVRGAAVETTVSTISTTFLPNRLGRSLLQGFLGAPVLEGGGVEEVLRLAEWSGGPNSSGRRIRTQLDGASLHQALGLEGLATDADGRFHIEGLGYDTSAILEIDGAGFAQRIVGVRTRRMEPERALAHTPEIDLENQREYGLEGVTEWTRSSSGKGVLIYGAEFTTTLEPERIVEGVVREAGTRRPIAGIVVAAATGLGDDGPLSARFATETDAQGRYRLAGLPSADGKPPWISVHPRADQPYFVAQGLTPPDAPGVPASLDVDMPEGRWIVGKVTDAADGRPVAANVDYAPMAANPHKPPPAGREAAVMGRPRGLHGARFRTAQDGTFRVLGLPGPGVVLVRADDSAYLPGVGGETIERDVRSPKRLATTLLTPPEAFHALKLVDVPEVDGPPTACDLQVDSGGSVVLRFVDEAGRPVEATVWGRTPNRLPGLGGRVPQEVPAAEVRVMGLAPGESRPVMISRKDAREGTTTTVQAGPDRTVVLHPRVTITGRLVHTDGKPARGNVDVYFDPVGRGMGPPFTFPHPSSLLDEQGRFYCFMPPGGPYLVKASNLVRAGLTSMSFSSEKVPGGFKAFAVAKGLMIEPGRRVDLGTIDVDTGERKEEAGAGPPP